MQRAGYTDIPAERPRCYAGVGAWKKWCVPPDKTAADVVAEMDRKRPIPPTNPLRAVDSRTIVVTEDAATLQATPSIRPRSVDVGDCSFSDGKDNICLDRIGQGIITRSPDGHYWLDTKLNTGAWTAVDLGTTRP